MARLDVYRINARQCALDCQSNLLDHFATRFVIPLLRPGDVPDQIDVLHPMFEIAGQQMILATHLAGTVSKNRLRTWIGSLAHSAYDVERALDALTSSA